jgi:RNA polymerase sigma factor for flagellar operon FliA
MDSNSIGFPEVGNLDQYYGLVLFQSRKVYRRLVSVGAEEISLAELTSEGLTGLVDARNKFNPGKRVKFSTYALYRINGAIMDYLRREDPLTYSQRKAVKKLENAREELTKHIHRKPEISELAKALSISADEVERIESLRVTLISLENLFLSNPEGEDPFAEGILSSSQSNPEKQTANRQLSQHVNECLEEALDGELRMILNCRVLEDFTLDVLSKFMGKPIPTVNRYEKKAKTMMRQCLESKGWELADIIELIP